MLPINGHGPLPPPINGHGHLMLPMNGYRHPMLPINDHGHMMHPSMGMDIQSHLSSLTGIQYRLSLSTGTLAPTVIGLPQHGTKPNRQGQWSKGRPKANPNQNTGWIAIPPSDRQTCWSHRVPSLQWGTGNVCLKLPISGQCFLGNRQCSRLMHRWPMSTTCCCFTILLFSMYNISNRTR